MLSKRRRLRRAILGTAVVVIGGPSLYILAALSLALIPVNRGFVEPEEGIEIFVVSNGIHVDFLVPVKTTVKDWSEQIPRSDFSGIDEAWSYLCLGWGNRTLYLETPAWKDLKLSTAANAIFLPGPSVVHAQYVAARPSESESRRCIRLSPDDYRKLCSHLEGSFQRSADGEFILIPGKGYYSTDNFFEGEGSYHAFNTCNNWANHGLKRIGVRTAFWSPLAGGILRHLPRKPPE